KREPASRRCFLEHGIAGDVARQQIRRELHATRVEPERMRESLDKFGFAKTRESLEQQMSPREHTGDNQLDELLLSEQHALQRGDEPVERCGGVSKFSLGRWIGSEDGSHAKSTCPRNTRTTQKVISHADRAGVSSVCSECSVS